MSSHGMYPTEDGPSYKQQQQQAEEEAARQQARVAAARAKAEAARVAVEHRRSLHSGDTANAVDPNRAFGEAGTGMHPTEDSIVIVKTRSTPPAPALAPAVNLESNEAKLARLRREYEQLQHDDHTLEERLQVQSEVITLRKELAVVQEDEERLRNQLEVTRRLVESHDPEVTKELAILEDEAQNSSLEKLWAEECNKDFMDKLEWGNIDIDNLMDRLEVARRDFTVANEKAESLYAQQEEHINANTDSRDRAKAQFAESYEEEMANLTEARARIRQVESERAHHYKRGTNRRGPLNVIPKEKKTVSRQRRIDDTEGRTTAQVEAMNSQLTDLMEDCKMLKKRLDCVRVENGKKKSENDVVLATIESEGFDTREFKEKLEQENKELMELKADLQGVLNYVRVKRREDEEL